MADMRQVSAIVRADCVPDLVRALKKAGVARLYLSHVHALGAGVDPEDFRASMDEGSLYTQKSRVEFLCRAEDTEGLVDVIRQRACSGHRGDGVIVVSDVVDVVSIRTGDRDMTALL